MRNHRLPDARAALLLAALAAFTGCASAQGEDKVSLSDPPAPPADRPAAAAPAPAPPPAAPTALDVLRLTGITQPPRVSAVAARGAGILKSIAVDEGDYVEAGATIARLDETHVALQQRHARAQLKAAEVQLAAATREQDRMSKLAGMKATPQANVDRAETSAEAAAAQVELAKVGLAMARQAERDAEVKAPFAGVVLQRMKSPGEWVATTPPAPLVQLAQVQPMELRVDVPEPFLARVAKGQTLQVTLTALGRTETATITRVLPEVKAATRTFTLVAELPNAARDIPVGTFAEVELRPAPTPAAEVER